MKTNGFLFLTGTQFSLMERKLKNNKISHKTFNPEDWWTIKQKNRLAQWRLNEGLTLRELVKQLKKAGFTYSHQYVYQVEANETTPSNDFMFALRYVFHISIDDVFFNLEDLKII